MATYLEIAAERSRGINWVGVNLASHEGVHKCDITNLPTQFMEIMPDQIIRIHGKKK